MDFSSFTVTLLGPSGTPIVASSSSSPRDEEKEKKLSSWTSLFSHYLFKLNAIVDVDSGHWCGVN